MAKRGSELETRFTGDDRRFQRVAARVENRGKRIGKVFGTVTGGALGGVTGFVFGRSLELIRQKAEDSITSFDRLANAVTPFAVGLDVVLGKLLDIADQIGSIFGFEPFQGDGVNREEVRRRIRQDLRDTANDLRARDAALNMGAIVSGLRGFDPGATLGGAGAAAGQSPGIQIARRQLTEMQKIKEDIGRQLAIIEAELAAE